MSEEQLTKKERKELKKQEQEAARKREAEAKRAEQTKTWTIVIISAVVIVGFLAWIISAAPERDRPVDATPGELNPVTEADHAKGASAEDARLTVIEFGDFECPACGQYFPIIAQLAEDFEGEVRFVYRHLPLRHIHFNAQVAAEYAEAAGRQGMFWEMHDLMFANQGEWIGGSGRAVENIFTGYAEQIGLDLAQLELDLEDPEIRTKIENDRTDAIGAGAQATPSFAINGQLIQNPPSYEAFAALLNAELGVGEPTIQIDPPALDLDAGPADTSMEDTEGESMMMEHDDAMMTEDEN